MKIRKGSKFCWMVKEYKKGWRLGLAIGRDISYLNYWFKKEPGKKIETVIEEYIRGNIVWIEARYCIKRKDIK